MLENIISQNELTFMIGLAVSIITGFVIGVERESRGKDAGISTHILVISGSMTFSFISMVFAPDDATRIAANIVTGIGFLGAGLILKEGTNVRNLTTAASIWFAGAIGMAIGFGYYAIAIIASIVSIAVPRIPHFDKLTSDTPNNKE